MNTDPREFAQIAAAPAPRLDMYSGIHKALRALMADTLLALGRMDAHDELELAQATQRVIELVEFCAAHLKHENDFVHPAIEARAPGASGAIAREHAQHLAHVAQIADAAAALRLQPAESRMAAAAALYRQLALFIAENFEHMNVEETAHNAVLWAHYSDAELAAIHDALVAAIPPEEMMFVARWMIPSLCPAERAGVLLDIRGKAPAPAFEAVLATVQPHLDTRAWAKLAASLGLDAAPGLVAA
ncbi:MAG: hypothetical protein EOO25_06620 [Comamonadaceae bacterium]|nr:MAG: hypothetical protein EOO25_06620 [Comamonadaceae bacterium]